MPGRMVRIGEGEDIHVLGQISVGDEHLGAVDHPLVPLLNRAGEAPVTSEPASGSVMAVPRMASPDTKGEDTSLLLLLAEEQEEFGAEGAGNDSIAHARVHGPEFLRDQAVLEKPEPAPSYFSSMNTPTKPSSQALRQMPRSKVSFRSNSRAFSGNSLRQTPWPP